MFHSIADHRASSHDVEQSCIALYCLTAGGPNAALRDSVRGGGLANVSAVLVDRVGDVDVQRAVTGVLWNLSADPALHDALVSPAGSSPSVLDKVLASMDAHPLSSVVQEQACGFLWSLLSNPDTRAALDADHVSACLSRVLRAMQLHLGSAEVQEAACAALNNLLSCDHVDVTQLGYHVAGEGEGDDKAAAAGGGGGGLGGGVSRVPGVVSARHDIGGVALAMGAMQRVVQCMDAHRAHAGVQEKACMALWSLLSPLDMDASVHPAGKAAAGAAGAMGRVVAVRQRFSTNSGVVAAAEGALSMLLVR